MDKQYGAVELAAGGAPFRTALTIATRVVSTVQPDRVIVDAGLKAMATEAGPALVASGAPADAPVSVHGRRARRAAVRGRARNGRSSAISSRSSRRIATRPSTCTTGSTWCKADKLVDIWPLDARGY